jgi:hypothetical protein
MDDQIQIKNYHDLLINLSKTFDKLKTEELRDLLFFLSEFEKDHVIPEDIFIYVSQVNIESLEIQSKDKASNITIGGISKYMNIKYSKNELPPIVIVKGAYRYLILYGESYAIEAYFRKTPIKAIVLDLEERDIFETFEIDYTQSVFLLPILENYAKNK